MGGGGKSDASRALGSGPGRPVGDRGDRGAPRGSAGAAGRQRGDCGRVLPGDTGDCSRRVPDHTRDRGRTAAGTTGRPASGGSPRPRGPGDVRRAVDKGAGMCDNCTKPPIPPRGGCARGPGGSRSGPSSFSLRGRGSLPENSPTFHSQLGRVFGFIRFQVSGNPPAMTTSWKTSSGRRQTYAVVISPRKPALYTLSRPSASNTIRYIPLQM